MDPQSMRPPPIEDIMTTRQQQRQRERALFKQGEAAIARGLPATPQKADIVAVAFVLARTLHDNEEPQRASRAAALMQALGEASARRQPGEARLACQKGCSHCCHSWVGATAPEIILLASAIQAHAKREPTAPVDAVLARAEPLKGLTPAQRFGAKLACPLLVAGTCTRYRERPMTCRQTTSLDISGCIDELEGRGAGEDVKVSAIHLAHARNARVPLLAALAQCRLPTHLYELSEGLARALQTDNVETRWLAGEDVFAGVQRGPAEAVAAQQAISAILQDLAPLARD
jgi:Fe-S-cluster containining protein